jgi:hypothetical protein
MPDNWSMVLDNWAGAAPVDAAAGFTGSRKGMTESQLHKLAISLKERGARVLHHGDCVSGDEQAHEIARSMGLRVVVHPPDDPKLRAYCQADELHWPKPYLKRNEAIVDACDFLVAAPKEMEEPPPARGQGTWSCVRYARRVGKPVVILWP